jgi:uncharacterized protein (UPF0179 family)
MGELIRLVRQIRVGEKFETKKLNFAYCNEQHKCFDCRRSQTCVCITPDLGYSNGPN